MMLKTEFEALTGFYPSDDMYTFIEKAYMDMQDVDKTMFCQMYKNNTDGLAAKIQLACDIARNQKENQTVSRIENLESQLESVMHKYDLEQEWRPYYDKQMIPMEEYDDMRCHCHKVLNTLEAKTFLRNTFGFDTECIEIKREIEKMEINRHHVIRTVPNKKIRRDPIYEATDMNYILFRCKGYLYECVDGELNLIR